MNYVKFGHGQRRVMCLHGWFGDERFLSRMREFLCFDAFTFVCPAFRGYGASRDIQGNFSLEEMTSDVIALADQLNWHRFALLSHSMGSVVAHSVIENNQDRLTAFVGISPIPPSGFPMDAPTIDIFERATHVPDLRKQIILASSGGKASQSWVDSIATTSSASSPTAFASYFHVWQAGLKNHQTFSSGIPSLFLTGALDPFVTRRFVEDKMLGHYAHAEVIELDRVGHYAQEELCLNTTSLVEEFLMMHFQ